MATITVRNLSAEVQRALKQRAAANDRSMEAEARVILENAVAQRNFVEVWLQATEDLQGEPIPLPDRSSPRTVELT